MALFALKAAYLFLMLLASRIHCVLIAYSSVKMVNQLLAGVHIAVSAEAMAFGVRLGLESRLLYDFIEKSDGCSWMFTNRVPHMLSSDYTPLSAVDIFVKDLVFTHTPKLMMALRWHVCQHLPDSMSP
ncbi:hypothetical protein Mapa_013555 [Marchantia paleacea]|nr:hypothetical protein Mapa_013555 [Marchantia paleacea]